MLSWAPLLVDDLTKTAETFPDLHLGGKVSKLFLTLVVKAAA